MVEIIILSKKVSVLVDFFFYKMTSYADLIEIVNATFEPETLVFRCASMNSCACKQNTYVCVREVLISDRRRVMESDLFVKMIVLIAAGLYEKERGRGDGAYKYSNKLIHGMNLFTAQSLLHSEDFKMLLQDMNEASFILKYASKPVCTWFKTWKAETASNLKKESLWNTGALVQIFGDLEYTVTEECRDLIDRYGHDLLNDIEQKILYEHIRKLAQEDYVVIRIFIIENPIVSEGGLRNIKLKYCDNEDAQNALNHAYEEIPDGCYKCDICGWTLHFVKGEARCCKDSCTQKTVDKEELVRVQPYDNRRLKRGIMQYTNIPGQLELEIKKYAESNKCKVELWPEMDRYDAGITFPNNTYWAIDAKTYANPYGLRDAIVKSSGFYGVRCDAAYYVIPDELKKEKPDYCAICNEVLIGKQPKTKCITFRDLKRAIKAVI